MTNGTTTWSLYLFQMTCSSNVLPLHPSHPHDLVPRLSSLAVTRLDSHREADILVLMMAIMHLFGLLIPHNVWPVITWASSMLGCSMLGLHLLAHHTSSLRHHLLKPLLETPIT